MKISETLQNARQILLDTGWCQGVLESKNGRCCALGALRKGTSFNVYRENVDSFNARAFLETEVLDQYLPEWNDTFVRTAPEVIEMFDIAISMAMSDGK